MFKEGNSFKVYMIHWKCSVQRPETLLKRDSNTGFFTVVFAKFLRTPIFKNTYFEEHLRTTASDDNIEATVLTYFRPQAYITTVAITQFYFYFIILIDYLEVIQKLFLRTLHEKCRLNYILFIKGVLLRNTKDSPI